MALMDLNPPHNAQAERYLLSMCLSGGTAAVDHITSMVSLEHFFKPAHHAIFNSILTLWAKRTSITWEAVVYGLGDFPDVDDEQGTDIKHYVHQIHRAVPFERTQADYLCADLEEKFQLRRLGRVADWTKEAVSAGIKSSDEIRFELSEQAILTGTAGSRMGRTVGQVLNDGFREELLGRLDNPNNVTGIKTGVWAIDNVLGGLEKGRVYTGLAGTGLGKSYWVDWLALEIAHRGHRPIIFSTEMNDREVINRMIYMQAGMDSLPFRRGAKKPTPDERERLEQASYDVGNLPISVISAGGLDVQAMAMEIKRQQALMGADMVFIDHIQGLRAKGMTMGEERVLLNEVTSFIKATALNLDIPFMPISHVKRPPKGEMARPTMDDGHGSGSIERDSDAVFTIHPIVYSEQSGGLVNFASRDKYNEVKERDGRVAMEIMWHKSRSGGSPVGYYYLNFNQGGRWIKIKERG